MTTSCGRQEGLGGTGGFPRGDTPTRGVGGGEKPRAAELKAEEAA